MIPRSLWCEISPVFILIICILYFNMVVSTRGEDSGSGSSSGFGAEPINERIHEFITSKITHGTLDTTYVMFGTKKERVMELL